MDVPSLVDGFEGFPHLPLETSPGNDAGCGERLFTIGNFVFAFAS